MDTRSTRRGLFAFAFACVMSATGSAVAHDGVKLEQDTCVVKVGPVKVHFIGYQRTGEPQEFCQDIAQTGPTVIALSALEDRLPDNYIVQNQAPAAAPASPSVDLREIAIGVRIVEDVGEEKEKADIGAVTTYYAPPKLHRNATMTFEHDFRKAGHYVAIITVADRDGQEWSARFPFAVGLFSLWNMLDYVLYVFGFVSLCAFLWYVLGRRAGPTEAEHASAAFHQAE
jgi:hypothetical protein